MRGEYVMPHFSEETSFVSILGTEVQEDARFSTLKPRIRPGAGLNVSVSIFLFCLSVC